MLAATLLILMVPLALIAYRQWRYGEGHYPFVLGRTPDQGMDAHPDPQPGADLETVTDDDFPGFQGADRSGAVDRIALEPDWSNRPPRLVWRKALGAGYSSFAVVNGFAVTMEQRGNLEQVTCHDIRTGEHKWTTGWNERFVILGVGPRSTPSISGGLVYALGAWGHLACLDGRTGDVVWQRELITDLGMQWNDENRRVRFGRANSPLIADGRVIVPGGGLPGQTVSLVAYDARTGQRHWQAGDRPISYSSPTMAKLLGRRQILIVNEDTVSGHAPETGAELWSHPWPGDSTTDANVSQPVALSTNRVLLSAGYRRGAMVIELSQAGDGEPIVARRVWKRSTVLNTKFTNVAIWENHAYGLSEGVLECVNLDTGERRWKVGRYGHGQILRIRDHLLIQAEKGELALVRLDPGTPNHVEGRIQALNGTTWNTPALYGRLLLVRNAAEAACYELAVRTREVCPQP